MKKILIIEDEESIRGFLKINLKRNGYEVIEADNGELGVKLALKEKPAIIILDVMLPGIDGFNVCKIIRNEDEKVGIIMLTAKSQDLDKIMGLEYGADDYIIKPFNPMELLLRIKALLRRISDYEEKKGIIQGKFKLDIYAKRIFKNNKENIRILNIGNWNGIKIESKKLSLAIPNTNVPYITTIIDTKKIALYFSLEVI